MALDVWAKVSYTLTSLRKCISKFSEFTGTPYVLHSGDLKVDDGIAFLPLYMTPFL